MADKRAFTSHNNHLDRGVHCINVTKIGAIECVVGLGLRGRMDCAYPFQATRCGLADNGDRACNRSPAKNEWRTYSYKMYLGFLGLVAAIVIAALGEPLIAVVGVVVFVTFLSLVHLTQRPDGTKSD